MNCDNVVSTLLLHNDPDYLLFKVAIRFAEQGLGVWFISIAPFEKIPENIQQPCKEVLQLLTFIYLKDYSDLVKHLNGIHKWSTLPNLVIVKDFTKYCCLCGVEYNSLQTAFLCSTLLDSVAFLSRKKQCKAFLLVCCSNLNDQIIKERLQVLYDMYFNNILIQDDIHTDEKLIAKVEKEILK